MNVAINFNAVKKCYGSFTAVDCLNLSIPSGGIFAMLGPNGAGKTTTIKMLMGMLQPTSGSLSVFGLDAFRNSVEIKARVGYLPDEPTFYDFMRGREIIRFAGEMHGLRRNVIDGLSDELAQRLEISDALDEFAHNYSRGMKKKLGLICALMHGPQLLILDEPTSGLDPRATHILHSMMRELTAEGNTILFSTHLLEQAEQLCDQVAIICRGALVATGPLTTLRQQFGDEAKLTEIFLQLTNDDSPSHAVLETDEGSTP